jgi:LacI family transcriptional regulator
VAVLIEASNAYARGLLKGIHRYVQEEGNWTIFLPEHGRGDPPLDALARWEGDGAIVRIETPAIARAVEKLLATRRIPMVDVSAAGLVPNLPCVETDDDAIGRVAAKHFLDRDFQHYAYLGDERFRWSENRRQAFVAAVEAAGHEVDVFNAPRGDAAERDNDAIESWLVSLPKPLAVFTCYDIRGRQALDACRRADLAVPDTVAVLGVDDDELLCSLSSVPLSSVIPDAAGAGWQAASVLGRLMRGELVERSLWLLPPLGISARQSTDTMWVEDATVMTSLRYIRAHACEGIKVTDVAREAGVTRRVLEAKFLKHVRTSVHESIARVQFVRIEELLRSTELPLAAIATRTGFKHAEYLSVAFSRRYRMPPSRWRAENR